MSAAPAAPALPAEGLVAAERRHASSSPPTAPCAPRACRSTRRTSTLDARDGAFRPRAREGAGPRPCARGDGTARPPLLAAAPPPPASGAAWPRRSTRRRASRSRGDATALGRRPLTARLRDAAKPNARAALDRRARSPRAAPAPSRSRPATKRLRVALGAGLVALVTRSGEGLALLGAMDAPSDETLDTDGDRITFLEPRARSRASRSTSSRRSRRWRRSVRARRSTRRFPDAGTLRIPVAAPAAGESRTLHVRGASGPATLLSSDGRNARGADLAVPAAGGTLLLPHAPGLVLAWVDRPGREAEDLFGAAAGDQSARTSVPPRRPRSRGRVAAFDVDAVRPGARRAPRPRSRADARACEGGLARGGDPQGRASASTPTRRAERRASSSARSAAGRSAAARRSPRPP